MHPGATLAGALVASADTAALVTRYAVRRLPGIAAIGAPLAAGSLGPTTAVAADDRGGLRLAIKLSVR